MLVSIGFVNQQGIKVIETNGEKLDDLSDSVNQKEENRKSSEVTIIQKIRCYFMNDTYDFVKR